MQRPVLYILLFLVFVGCKRCPVFTDDLLNWQPYQTGEVLYFESADKITKTFKINKHTLTGGERYKGNCECVCKVKSVISAESTTNSTEYFNFSINDLEDNMLIVEINNSFFSCIPNFKKGSYFIEYFKYNEDIKNWDTADLTIQSKDLSGISYSDVIEIEVDTIIYPEYPIWKLSIAKNHGIISFIEKDTQREYFLKTL